MPPKFEVRMTASVPSTWPLCSAYRTLPRTLKPPDQSDSLHWVQLPLRQLRLLPHKINSGHLKTTASLSRVGLLRNPTLRLRVRPVRRFSREVSPARRIFVSFLVVLLGTVTSWASHVYAACHRLGNRCPGNTGFVL